MSATPKTKKVTIVHVSKPRTVTVYGAVFMPHATKGNLLSRGTCALHCNDVEHNRRLVSRILVTLFHTPRSFANRSAMRVAYRNSICVRRRVVRLLVRENYHSTLPNRCARHTFVGNGVSLDRTRTITSLVTSASTNRRHLTLGRVHNNFDRRLGGLHRRLLRVASLVRLRLSFDSRRRLRFTSHDRLDALTTRVRAIVSHLTGSFDMKGTVGGNVPMTVVNRAGTKGSALLGILLGRSGTVIDSVRNAAHSIVRSAVGVKKVAFHFVSATNVHRARSTVRDVNVRQAFRGLSRTSVIL